MDLQGGNDFGEIRLIAIPPEVFTLSHLKNLDLRDNAIQIVPDDIKQIKQLKWLDLRGNPLRQVADVFGLFVHYADFKKLSLPFKNIIGLKLTLFSYDAPEHIFELPNLTALGITHHRLTQIPDWVFQLGNLTKLNVRNNKLSNMSGIEQLGNLSYLNLCDNPTLQKLPDELFALPKLEILQLLKIVPLPNHQLSS